MVVVTMAAKDIDMFDLDFRNPFIDFRGGVFKFIAEMAIFGQI